MLFLNGAPSGDYKIRYIDYNTYFWGVTDVVEWYNNKVDFTTATRVTVTAPNDTTSINAILGFENRFILPPILKLLMDTP